MCVSMRVRGVMVIFEGNGHANPSSNPCPGCLHFTWFLENIWIQLPATSEKMAGQNELFNLGFGNKSRRR